MALSMFDMEPDTPGFYYLVIKNPLQFHLIVDNISVEMSFRMAVQVILRADGSG